MNRFTATLAWSAALAMASEAIGQTDDALAEETPEAAVGSDQPAGDSDVNLDAIDALLGNTNVTSDDEGDDAANDAPSGENSDSEAGDEPLDGEASAEDDPDGPEPSDLDRAYASYSVCASVAGEAMEARGFSLEIIGEEALLRCSGERAAYVNAFYFTLLPRYSAEGDDEPAIRARAERLVAATDRFLMTKVAEESAALRTAREAEEAAAAAEEAAALAAAAAEAAAIEAAEVSADQGEEDAGPSSEDEDE